MISQIHLMLPIFVIMFSLLTPVGISEEIQRDRKSKRPLVSFVGADTRITKNERLRITSREEWIQFWLKHVGKAGSPQDYNDYRPSGAPHIDFDQCMVIAITESPGQTNAGIVAVEISESAKVIMFDYDNMFYQARAGTSAPGNAFGYYVLPRSDKAVVLRRNNQDGRSRYAGGPPEWKEISRFKALKTIEDDVKNSTPFALNIVFANDPGKGNYHGLGNSKGVWNFVDAGVTKFEKLRSSKGNETNVTLTMSENDGKWGIKGQVGVYQGYIYHNCRCVDLQAKITGMPTGRYKVYVFAHGDAPNQNAEIELIAGGEKFGSKSTLNDGTWDFQSREFVEGVQYVSFEFDVIDDKPVQITSRRSGSSYSMLNAIQILPVDRK